MPELYRVADFIADFIADIGVGHVFLLPGGGAMYLVDGVGKNLRIKVVACLHEQGATIAAEAYSRINENIGVAMVTSGPGATNAITAVAGAWIESVPMMVISGQVKRADMMRGAPLRQKGVQEVDIVQIVKSITKYAVTVEKPEDIRMVMEQAYYLAREGRSGPVWIDVPLDVQASVVDPATLKGWALPTAQPHDAISSAQLDKMMYMLSHAERPLILAGHGIRLSGGTDLFRKIVEQIRIPVVTTWNSLDLMAYDNPLYVGRPGVVALRAPNFAVQNCDLLISIGCRLDNIITAFNPRGFARAAQKVVVDVDHNELEKLDMEVQLPIQSDAKDFLLAFEGKLTRTPNTEWSSWRDRCLDWKKRYDVHHAHPLSGKTEISSYQFIDALSEVAKPDTLVSSGSSGLGVEVFYSIFRNKPGQRVFLTSGLGSMGYGLPAAIGACFANGCKPMIAVETDGSLQLNIQELATMRAFDLPITLFIMNNNGYASIRNTQRNYFDGRYVGTGPEAGLMLPDLEKVAATYGLSFVRIENSEDLQAQLLQALELKRPALIDVRIISNETLEPKVAAIPQTDGSMLSMPQEDMSPLLPLEVLKSEMIISLLKSSITSRQ